MKLTYFATAIIDQPEFNLKNPTINQESQRAAMFAVSSEQCLWLRSSQEGTRGQPKVASEGHSLAGHTEMFP